jgi:hypothetical protein
MLSSGKGVLFTASGVDVVSCEHFLNGVLEHHRSHVRLFTLASVLVLYFFVYS